MNHIFVLYCILYLYAATGTNPMTPTMHKILIHGAIVIKNALLPIGQLSEEAAEARNKHLLSRQDFARKFSRESCNRDIYNHLKLSSDPLLSSMRKIKKRELKSFFARDYIFTDACGASFCSRRRKCTRRSIIWFIIYNFYIIYFRNLIFVIISMYLKK